MSTGTGRGMVWSTQVFGCTIEVAHDGMEAIDKMAVGAFDIVLMVSREPPIDSAAVLKLHSTRVA